MPAPYILIQSPFERGAKIDLSLPHFYFLFIEIRKYRIYMRKQATLTKFARWLADLLQFVNCLYLDGF